jgi:hypothetical protein
MTFDPKILIRSVFVAPFVLVGGLSAMAVSAPAELRPAAQIKMADAGTSATDRATYEQKARAELQAWRVKLDQFGESAKAESLEARKTASDDLNKAWAKAKEASARLEASSAAEWESAKASFKTAADDLSAKWTKLRGDAK